MSRPATFAWAVAERAVGHLTGAWARVRGVSPWRRRTLLFLTVFLGAPLAAAVPAYADGGSPNVWLSMSPLKDSHGFTIDQYQLVLDEGNISTLWKGVFSTLAQLGWLLYRFWVGTVLWLADTVLQFKALSWLRPPFQATGDAVQTVVHQIGVAGTVGVVSVLFSGLLLFKAKHGAAFGEMAVTVVITALMGTAVANPMGWVAGDNGLLAKTQQFGLAVSDQLLSQAQSSGAAGTTPSTTPDQARLAIEARILDVMVRMPHQLINYGEVIDTQPAKCKKAYDTTLGKDGARDAVAGACNQTAKDAPDNPGGALMGVVVVGISGSFFFLVMLTFSVALTVLLGLTLYEACKFVVELLRSILPGSTRLGAFISLGVIVTAAFFASLTLVAMTLLMLLLSQVFLTTKDATPASIFMIVDILLVSTVIAVLVLAIRAKKTGRRLGEGAGKGLASRPVSLPPAQTVGATLRGAAAPALAARQNVKLRRSMSGAGSGSSPLGIKPLARAGMKVAKIGAAATIGAPVAIPRAAAAAKKVAAVRKVALQDRLTATAGYGREYRHNLGVGAAAVGKVAGAAAMAGTAGGSHAAAAMAGVDPRIAAATARDTARTVAGKAKTGTRNAAVAAGVAFAPGLPGRDTGGPTPSLVHPPRPRPGPARPQGEPQKPVPRSPHPAGPRPQPAPSEAAAAARLQARLRQGQRQGKR